MEVNKVPPKDALDALDAVLAALLRAMGQRGVAFAMGLRRTPGSVQGPIGAVPPCVCSLRRAFNAPFVTEEDFRVRPMMFRCGVCVCGCLGSDVGEGGAAAPVLVM